jgi:hypothetical protein
MPFRIGVFLPGRPWIAEPCARTQGRLLLLRDMSFGRQGSFFHRRSLTVQFDTESLESE